MNLNLRATWLLQATLDARTRVIIHEGGSSSSKTYSIAQYIIIYCLTHTGKTVDIVRKTFPALRTSAMKDFFDCLKAVDLYDDAAHARTLNTYTMNGNIVQFYSLDDPQKAHGPRRDLLWLNEANDLTYADWQQLQMRTRERIIIDYNPSEPPEHWINAHVRCLPANKVTVIHSTYVDNPFLPDEQREEIERLRETDPALWSVYGLGIWAQMRGRIYNNRTELSQMPAGAHVYGVDFGHTNASAVVRVLLTGDDLYWQEVVYQTHLTTPDLVARMKEEGVPLKARLYCDAAEPDRIEELRRAGYDARAARKDVKNGIDFCQRYKIHFSGPNLAKEIAAYKWAENRAGEPLEMPVKFMDHAMDAARYATYTHYFSPPGRIEYKTVQRREAGFKEGGW